MPGAALTVFNIRRRQLLGRLKLRRHDEKLAINRAEYRVFSQHREDGIVDHLLDVVGVGPAVFVEFGFAPDVCNCLNLLLGRHFSGLFIDGAQAKCTLAREVFHRLGRKDVAVACEFLTTSNLNEVISGSGVRGEIDVLSIDVDGNDYWFWEALESVTPRIVVIEYNASFGPSRSLTVPYDPEFVRYQKHDSGLYHGASLTALQRLGKRKGYRLVGCDSTGVNAFFLRDDLAAEEIETLDVARAFRPNRSRLKYKGISQKAQFERINDMEFVEVP